ncbi:hypothetical protein IVA94_14855 [Bradyrhizobium sp. 156]|uniref:hypothetical protein n=1 Tax=Bradyrhizobium sp. 156 TaxID=2782630 RepID=UPI001FF7F51E|nr:hypothetical protein [Bradyrhizobium sp. 156]MCK1322148.1 hypothetical protein [Bradyrhizobium sp. 156]
MSALIAALDQALAQAGEDIILRRTVGTAPNQVNIDVRCRARVTALSTEQIQAGIPSTELNIIMSPSEISAAQWPGGQVPALPPFDVDQRIPRAGVTDKVLMRGQAPKAITFADPQIIAGELVRINLRVAG